MACAPGGGSAAALAECASVRAGPWQRRTSLYSRKAVRRPARGLAGRRASRRRRVGLGICLRRAWFEKALTGAPRRSASSEEENRSGRRCRGFCLFADAGPTPRRRHQIPSPDAPRADWLLAAVALRPTPSPEAHADVIACIRRAVSTTSLLQQTLAGSQVQASSAALVLVLT